MRKRTVVFYGDSNTYGYDPRGFFGGRYDTDTIWTYRVAEALGDTWEVINEGMNGRCLPDAAYSLRYMDSLLSELSETDLFVIMLGTNDLLMRLEPDERLPAGRMEQLLRHLKARAQCPVIRVIGPPLIGSGETPDPDLVRYKEANIRMNARFRQLAEKYEVMFADAAEWEIPLAFDGVHLSEEGHRIFADRMIPLLAGADSPDQRSGAEIAESPCYWPGCDL